MSASVFPPQPPEPKRIAMFKLPGRDRNLPCPCLSGKKWKKCHPFLPPDYRPPILQKDDAPEKLEADIDNYLKRVGLVKSLNG